MIYEEFAPSPDLCDVVSSFWRFELEAHDGQVVEHVVPPDGTVSVVVGIRLATPGPAVVVGPRMTALRVSVPRDVRYVGLRCAPAGGTAALLGVPPGDLRDRVAPLETLAPARAADLADALASSQHVADPIAALRAVAARWVRDAHVRDRAVVAMVDEVLAARGDITVARLCKATGLSYRQCLRRFQEAVGLSPKEFARLVRIRQACVRALGATAASWADVSAEAGFADQAHLGREFSDVFGWPPTLVREYLRRIEHLLID